MFRSWVQLLPFCVVVWCARRWCARQWIGDDVESLRVVHPFDGVFIECPLVSNGKAPAND